MLIHREYNNAYPSMFVIYKDRVETKNANKPVFVGQLLPGKFEPFPKNPNIAQIFTQMGRSEELGTGVKNVFKYSKAYSGSDDIVFEENDIFIAKVPLSYEGVNEGVNELLTLIAKNPGKRTPFFQEHLNVSVKTIERWLKRLKDNGDVYFKGAAKTGGYWKS